MFYHYSLKQRIMIKHLLFLVGILAIQSESFSQCDSVLIQTNFQTIPTICNSSNGSIRVNGSKGGTPPYSWALNDTNFSTISTFNSLIPGAYLLLTRDGLGCMDTSAVLVENRPLRNEFGIGNAFSPNDDGMNDELRISITNNIVASEIVFINQYGQRVYKTTSTDALQTWDGVHNGLPLPEGTYFYLVTASTLCEQGSFSGYITLLR